MQLFTTVFLSVLLTLVESRAIHADEYHYVKGLKAKVDDVFGKLEILENLIKQQNEVIDSQNKRITVLEDIVLQQTSRFNQEVTSQQKKVKGYHRRMHPRNTQEYDILHEKKRKEDYPKDIGSMLKISKAIKELNKEGVDRGAGVRGLRVRNRGWRVRNRGWRGREAGIEGAGGLEILGREIDFFIENSKKMAVLCL